MTWDEVRRSNLSKEREELLQNAERVQVTEENVKVVAKKTGRSVFELEKLMMEAQAKGHTCSVRIPQQ